jgi:(p)ppGpp synthase/HD superfamily hydrolase
MMDEPDEAIRDRARVFAALWHGDQKYGDQPYLAHLDAVAEILAPYGPAVQAIGYLHDVAEDTPITARDLELTFGWRIAWAVSLVTDEAGRNRRERKAGTNVKLAGIGNSDEDRPALIVKAADRLANLRASSADDGSKLAMYRREHAEFRRAACRPGLCDELWGEIDAIIAGTREPTRNDQG